ncbi:MAG: hypothetical protein E6Q97_08980 [Desulfurellales bacterium]|nr:MAG: hypothetical protein E6Q97_08980 [Desulfurellales bacterium]
MLEIAYKAVVLASDEQFGKRIAELQAELEFLLCVQRIRKRTETSGVLLSETEATKQEIVATQSPVPSQDASNNESERAALRVAETSTAVRITPSRTGARKLRSWSDVAGKGNAAKAQPEPERAALPVSQSTQEDTSQRTVSPVPVVTQATSVVFVPEGAPVKPKWFENLDGHSEPNAVPEAAVVQTVDMAKHTKRTRQDAYREKIRDCIRANGPMSQEKLCKLCNIPGGSITAVLKHEWFEKCEHGINLKAKYR